MRVVLLLAVLVACTDARSEYEALSKRAVEIGQRADNVSAATATWAEEVEAWASINEVDVDTPTLLLSLITRTSALHVSSSQAHASPVGAAYGRLETTITELKRDQNDIDREWLEVLGELDAWADRHGVESTERVDESRHGPGFVPFLEPADPVLPNQAQGSCKSLKFTSDGICFFHSTLCIEEFINDFPIFWKQLCIYKCYDFVVDPSTVNPVLVQ